jgi:hypothetical protein
VTEIPLCTGDLVRPCGFPNVARREPARQPKQSVLETRGEDCELLVRIGLIFLQHHETRESQDNTFP